VARSATAVVLPLSPTAMSKAATPERVTSMSARDSFAIPALARMARGVRPTTTTAICACNRTHLASMPATTLLCPRALRRTWRATHDLPMCQPFQTPAAALPRSWTWALTNAFGQPSSGVTSSTTTASGTRTRDWPMATRRPTSTTTAPLPRTRSRCCPAARGRCPTTPAT